MSIALVPGPVIDRCAYYGHTNDDGHECPPVELVRCRRHGLTEIDDSMGMCAWCVEDYFSPDLGPDEDGLAAALNIGTCAWGSGASGRIGMVHIGTVNGQREECCTFA